jgi:type I restriction enzyme R subunit
MATGTGKTRVAMALVDIFLRSNQARRILFVADRDELVKQARNEGFREHLPGEPCTRLRSYEIDTTSRLYVVTLQTLSNIFRQFSPAFFDLIAFDEVHRSIFNKWNDVLHYFDARMIGLTATPAGFIDRNTFLEFECFDGKPTFLYTLRDAVKEGYLVDYTLYAAQTRFQRQGIRGVDLGEEQRNLLIAQGLDPDAIDFSGTELERKVTNRDTLRQQWLELMEVIYKDASGQLPAKTIIFAMTQEHALRLAEVFAELYPQFPGLVQVITYKSDFHSTLIDRFKTEDMPRIAISVDMLETGVNVPEVCNLVFMRPVQSRIKLEQMIGRGTRNQETCKRLDWLPNGRKDDFLIVDFWENDFSKTPQPEVAQSLPVLVNLFNTRLALLEQMLGGARVGAASGELRGASATEVAVRERAIADLRAMVEQHSTRRVCGEAQPAADRAGVDGRILALSAAGAPDVLAPAGGAAAALRRRRGCSRGDLHAQGGAAQAAVPHRPAHRRPRRRPSPRTRRACPTSCAKTRPAPPPSSAVSPT